MNDLSNIHENDKDSSENLLGPQEKLILEQIAAGEPPHSQRAQSLLAIDAGVTQKTAAQQSGLTVGQVSYWLGKFRREGMAIFPEELLRQSESPAADINPEKIEGEKVKSKQDKASKKVKKEKKSPAEEAKSEKKAKTKKKSKKGKASKKAKKGKKNGKKKQAKKSKKEKKKKDKKK